MDGAPSLSPLDDAVRGDLPPSGTVVRTRPPAYGARGTSRRQTCLVNRRGPPDARMRASSRSGTDRVTARRTSNVAPMPPCQGRSTEGAQAPTTAAGGHHRGGHESLALRSPQPIVRRLPVRRHVSGSPRGRKSRHWRDGRVAEGARLESVYTGNRIAGSNPAPSARSSI